MFICFTDLLVFRLEAIINNHVDKNIILYTFPKTNRCGVVCVDQGGIRQGT